MTLLLKSDKAIGEPASLSLKSVQTDKYNTVFAGHKSIFNFIDLPDTVADGNPIDDVYILGKQASTLGSQSNITANKGISFIENATDKAVILPDAWDLNKYIGTESTVVMGIWLTLNTTPAATLGIYGWKYSSNTQFYVTINSASRIQAFAGDKAVGLNTLTVAQRVLIHFEFKFSSVGNSVACGVNGTIMESMTNVTYATPSGSSPRIGKIDSFNSAGFTVHRAFLRKFDPAKTTAAAIISDEYNKFFSKL